MSRGRQPSTPRMPNGRTSFVLEGISTPRFRSGSSIMSSQNTEKPDETSEGQKRKTKTRELSPLSGTSHAAHGALRQEAPPATLPDA